MNKAAKATILKAETTQFRPYSISSMGESRGPKVRSARGGRSRSSSRGSQHSSASRRSRRGAQEESTDLRVGKFQNLHLAIEKYINGKPFTSHISRRIEGSPSLQHQKPAPCSEVEREFLSKHRVVPVQREGRLPVRGDLQPQTHQGSPTHQLGLIAEGGTDMRGIERVNQT